MSIDINDVFFFFLICLFLFKFLRSHVLKDVVKGCSTSTQLVNGSFTAQAPLELLLPSFITVVSTTGAM